MKRFLVFLGAIVLFFSSSAQSNWKWGFGAGSTIYFGDLGNEQYVPISGINHGMGVTLQRPIYSGMSYINGNAPFMLQAQATWHRIGYDETKPLLFNAASGTELRNFRRGLNFRNDLIGVNAQLIYTLYPWPNKPLSDHKFAFYFFAGPGIFYSDPRADLFRGDIDIANRYYYWDDGTLRDNSRELRTGDVVERDGIYETHLHDWYTEGESPEPAPGRTPIYSQFQIGFPHGGGIKYGISRNITLQFEACFYDFPFTDYLDDASYRYATYEEIESNFPGDPVKQELAKYITDPSGWGSDGENGIYASPRGNPKKFDWINYMNVQLIFDINQHSHSYNGKSKSKRYCPSFKRK